MHQCAEHLPNLWEDVHPSYSASAQVIPGVTLGSTAAPVQLHLHQLPNLLA